MNMILIRKLTERMQARRLTEYPNNPECADFGILASIVMKARYSKDAECKAWARSLILREKARTI